MTTHILGMSPLSFSTSLKTSKLSALLLLVSCFICGQASTLSNSCAKAHKDSTKKLEKTFEVNDLEEAANLVKDGPCNISTSKITYNFSQQNKAIFFSSIFSKNTDVSLLIRGPPTHS